MTIESDLERIVNLPTSKADRARALFALGCDKRDVVELLNMAYSQAHSIWLKGNFDGSRHSSAVDGRPPNRSHTGSGQTGDDVEPSRGGSQRSGRLPRGGSYLHLSPSQVRYITQDGHVVVRLDRDNGTVCANCGERLVFALEYLGFIHAYSKAVPTDIEDHYAQ